MAEGCARQLAAGDKSASGCGNQLEREANARQVKNDRYKPGKMTESERQQTQPSQPTNAITSEIVSRPSKVETAKLAVTSSCATS